MPLRTDAFQAKPAWHIVEQQPVFDLPWRVLRVGQRVQVDQRRAERGGDVGRPGVVRYHHRSERDRRAAGGADGADQRRFFGAAGQDHLAARRPRQLADHFSTVAPDSGATRPRRPGAARSRAGSGRCRCRSGVAAPIPDHRAARRTTARCRWCASRRWRPGRAGVALHGGSSAAVRTRRPSRTACDTGFRGSAPGAAGCRPGGTAGPPATRSGCRR